MSGLLSFLACACGTVRQILRHLHKLEAKASSRIVEILPGAAGARGWQMSSMKRDNEYYLGRLKAEHPVIHADYLAGKFKNASEAFEAAGLRKPVSGLVALRSAWKKATLAERDLFKLEIGCPAAALSAAPASTLAPSGRSPAIASSSTPAHGLPPDLERDMRSIMDRRRLKMGDVMRELGRNPRDASVGMALARNTRITGDLLADLEGWVRANKAT